MSLERVWCCDVYRAGDGVHQAWLNRRRRFFFFSSRRRHTRYWRDWSSDVCSSDLAWTNTLARSSRGALVPNRNRRQIDKRFRLDGELDKAIGKNEPIAALVGTGGEGEDAFERNDLGFDHLFEVYAPIESTKGRPHAIGAYEIYADPRALDRLIGSRRTMLWLAVG